MSDTQMLLGKIAALRQRLEQAEGLAREAGSAAASLAARGGEVSGRFRALAARLADGAENNRLLDTSLRQLTESVSGPTEPKVLPVQLTARARRILERGRDLLRQLRPLAEDLDAADPGDPLARHYRQAAAMTDAALRMVQAFPDSPSAQLRLCEGVEDVLGAAEERLAVVLAGVARRRQEEGRIATLAELLAALASGPAPALKPFVALAEALLMDAEEGAPLRFLAADANQPARFVACHSLTAAQVVARVLRHDPELRSRPLEPVLAALIHDVGMLQVPAEILAHPGPLGDEQRRRVEGHARAGAELAARLLPTGAWLSEAAVMHHERLDGTGYPDGLRELQIPALPRLLAVGDTYAALCCPRPHRPARETRTAMADTLLLAEQGALDRQHCERLLLLSFYPVGSVVELADGAVGVVVAAPTGKRDLNTPARPVVALLTSADGKVLTSPQHLD
ncbi:MAG TPA: HD domain-containing phosphohydrolase, partial [Gemmataceae bacterium]|nr:HD domain-containing phosphohydrolase [Gemmataceae bacterium]